MGLNKLLISLSAGILVLGLIVTGIFVFNQDLSAQRRTVWQIPREERVAAFFKAVKKGDRKVFRFVHYADLKDVIKDLSDQAVYNGRNFSEEITDNFDAATRRRVVESTLQGLFNRDPRVRLVAINWLRRLRPDNSMQRATKQAIALETVATETEKRKVKDLDLHDSGYMQDPDTLWTPDNEPIFASPNMPVYEGRTYWDGGDLWNGDYKTVDNNNSYVEASRTGSMGDPEQKPWYGKVVTDTIFYTKRTSGQIGYEGERGEWLKAVPHGVTSANIGDKIEQHQRDRYLAWTAWLDQGRWSSERSNHPHPAFLDDRTIDYLGTLGYRYSKIRRIKGEEQVFEEFDDVWDELNKLDLFITRDVWTKKIQRGETNTLRIISKDTFMSMCRRIDGEANEQIPFFNTDILGVDEVPVLIVGLLENRVVSTRYQCALTLSRIYQLNNCPPETRKQIRDALRLSRRQNLLIDLDKGREFIEWLDRNLDKRNKDVSHSYRHTGTKQTWTEDDEIDTSLVSKEVPIMVQINDWDKESDFVIKQYNDYEKRSSWNFMPMGTVSLKKPGEAKYFESRLPQIDYEKHPLESKEYVLYEEESLRGVDYAFNNRGGIKMVNRFAGYDYTGQDEAPFYLEKRIKDLMLENTLHSSLINYLEELKRNVDSYREVISVVGDTTADGGRRRAAEFQRIASVINEKINAIYKTETMLYDHLLEVDMRDQLIYDIVYGSHVNPAANPLTPEEITVLRDRITTRMRGLYVDYGHKIELTRLAVQAYIEGKISAQIKKSLNEDHVVIAGETVRLPLFPTTADAATDEDRIFIENYVDKPEEENLRIDAQTRTEWKTRATAPKWEAAVAPFPACMSMFFDEANVDHFIPGLKDEISKQGRWIEENRDMIVHYQYFLEENQKANRVIRALRTGNKRFMRLAGYPEVKNAFLIIMWKAGITLLDKYDGTPDSGPLRASADKNVTMFDIDPDATGGVYRHISASGMKGDRMRFASAAEKAHIHPFDMYGDGVTPPTGDDASEGRVNMIYNGVNDHRGDWSVRDKAFLDWLLSTGRQYENEVIDACLGGLMNEDPRVRLTCIHLLRRVGPDSKMKPDIELSLQDETVDERRDIYMVGEKKFVNFLDVYGDYQFKNVRKELQKLHAFILRQEMIEKIKSREEVNYLAEMSKTYFRILTYQIDRESWWRVPLGIDPEPDARILYESATGPRNDSVKKITFTPDTIRQYFDVIAGGIDNYYFTNQVETAAWIVRYYDESILRYYDRRTSDANTASGNWTVWFEFKYPRDHKTKAGTQIYDNTIATYMSDGTQIDNGKVKYNFTPDETFATWVWNSGTRTKFKQAITRGLERDIIVPYRKIRGQEFRYRDVVIVEDGSPVLIEDPATGASKHVLRGNAEGDKDNVTQVWYYKKTDGTFSDAQVIVLGTDKVLGSPSAVLANPENYDTTGESQTLDEYDLPAYKTKDTGLFYHEGAWGMWLNKTDIRQEDWTRQLTENIGEVTWKVKGQPLSAALRAEVTSPNGAVTAFNGKFDHRENTWYFFIRGEKGSKVQIKDKDGNLIFENGKAAEFVIPK